MIEGGRVQMECTPNLQRVMNGKAFAAKKTVFKRFEPLSVSLLGDITSEQQLDIGGNMNVAD